jgi:hypothetical protein
MRGSWRLLGALGIAATLTAATAACGGCDAKGCADAGVFLDLSAQPAAVSAEICIDGACATVPVERTSTGTTELGQQPFVQEVNNPRPLPVGKTVNVTINVFDQSHTVIGHLDDQRYVPNPTVSCTCSELGYLWKDDGLQPG